MPDVFAAHTIYIHPRDASILLELALNKCKTRVSSGIGSGFVAVLKRLGLLTVTGAGSGAVWTLDPKIAATCCFEWLEDGVPRSVRELSPVVARQDHAWLRDLEAIAAKKTTTPERWLETDMSVSVGFNRFSKLLERLDAEQLKTLADATLEEVCKQAGLLTGHLSALHARVMDEQMGRSEKCLQQAQARSVDLEEQLSRARAEEQAILARRNATDKPAHTPA